jgi:hypothetical protein
MAAASSEQKGIEVEVDLDSNGRMQIRHMMCGSDMDMRVRRLNVQGKDVELRCLTCKTKWMVWRKINPTGAKMPAPQKKRKTEDEDEEEEAEIRHIAARAGSVK